MTWGVLPSYAATSHQRALRCCWFLPNDHDNDAYSHMHQHLWKIISTTKKLAKKRHHFRVQHFRLPRNSWLQVHLYCMFVWKLTEEDHSFTVIAGGHRLGRQLILSGGFTVNPHFTTVLYKCLWLLIAAVTHASSISLSPPRVSSASAPLWSQTNPPTPPVSRRHDAITQGKKPIITQTF